MTIAEMFQLGMVFHLIGMAILFALMGLVISAIGSGQPAVKDSATSIEFKMSSNTSANAVAITAAITAAVYQYKKTTK